MCSAIQPLIDHHGTYTAPITTCVSGIACMPGNKRAHVPPLAEAQQTVPFSASKLLLSAQLGVLLSRDLTPSGDLPFCPTDTYCSRVAGCTVHHNTQSTKPPINIFTNVFLSCINHSQLDMCRPAYSACVVRLCASPLEWLRRVAATSNGSQEFDLIRKRCF